MKTGVFGYQEVHGYSKIGREYRLLIEVALSRLGVEASA